MLARTVMACTFAKRPTARISCAGAMGLLLAATSPVLAADPIVGLGSSNQVAGAEVAADANSNSQAADATEKRIDELIRQLGSPQFSARRTAANELRHIGAEAFDLLNVAKSNSDPEIAASAEYLLRQITVRWVQSDDSAAVRTVLRDYGEQSDEDRLQRVAALARLANAQGTAALCRIARFDRSPLVSRAAALAVIRPDAELAGRVAVDLEMVNRELGRSTREAANWLRHYTVQLRDPAEAIEVWQRLVNEETELVEQSPEQTSTGIIQGLLWNLADLHRQLGNTSGLTDSIDQMMQLHDELPDETAVQLLSWLTKHKSWDALDAVLSQHEGQLQKNKRAMYFAALARLQQGKQEEAEELAEKAALIEPQMRMESFIAARELEETSQFDWAVREYRRSIDGERVDSHDAILARISLANLLHDHEKNQEAADVLDPLVKSLLNEGRVGQLYTELQRRYYSRRGESMLPKSGELAGRFHYYRALQYQDEGDWKQVQQSLNDAIKSDPANADVLIAMYRVPDADEKWRHTTLARIRNLARQFQEEIDENPSDPIAYNQWAWLISNTQGDFQKAVRYSHKSLELIAADGGESAGASYLDTLGRCYYAAGDLENAVKYQRQAIEKVNYMQVMHRQMTQFEKELAEKNKSDSTNDN